MTEIYLHFLCVEAIMLTRSRRPCCWQWPWPKAVELKERVVMGWETDRHIWRPTGRQEIMPIITPACVQNYHRAHLCIN